MNETEFIKEHPSLKDKEIKAKHLIIANYPMNMYWMSDVHKTQIDKKKVKEVIDRITHLSRKGFRITESDIFEYKQELGLDTLFGMEIKEDKKLKGNEFRLE